MFFPHPRSVHRVWRVLLPLVASVVAACASPDRSRVSQAADSSAAPMSVHPSVSVVADTDDFGVPLPTDAQYATRVVSLNPAATEAIFAMGADARLVGRSKWDEYPAAAGALPALGDGIRPALEPLLAAQPTLVVLYATAENRAVADALTRAGIRVMALRVDRIAHFHTLVRALGVALGADARARAVSDSVQHTLDRVTTLTKGLARRPRVVWPVWGSPPMVIGGGSYIDELLTIAGAENVFHDMTQPSPTVSIEEIVKRAPDAIVTGAKRAGELASDNTWHAVPAVRNKQFVLQDPAITGRPSVVLGMAAVALARALHPELADALSARAP